MDLFMESREFLTKLKKADMRVKRSFLVFWLVPYVAVDMKPRMSSDEMTERSVSPIEDKKPGPKICVKQDTPADD
jgi:hypothetical protein